MAELYAIAGSMERARIMLAGGAPYLQLRFKERPLHSHSAEIREWKTLFPRTRVVVNDDLELALALDVWGVHLGQEDLTRYGEETVRSASLNVGISTHSDPEIERALACGPALLGFGPVFPTSSKEMTHRPQGISRLRELVRRLSLPLVAIGGIGGDNLAGVAATGVSLVAMISYLDRLRTPGEVRAFVEQVRSLPGA